MAELPCEVKPSESLSTEIAFAAIIQRTRRVASRTFRRDTGLQRHYRTWQRLRSRDPEGLTKASHPFENRWFRLRGYSHLYRPRRGIFLSTSH
jgi:hypothetical protein